MERLSATRQWAYLLIAAGNNDMAEGYTSKALEKYLAVIQMGQQVGRHPSAIEWLVGIAIESLGLGGINNFTIRGDANELYLEKAGQAVSGIKNDWSIDLTNIIEGEKLLHKNMVSKLFYEIDSKGKTRFNHDPYKYCTEANNGNFNGYWLKKLLKAYTILYWFYMPQKPEKMGEIVDAGFNKLYTMANPDFDWSKEPNNVPIESLMQWKMNFQYLTELTRKMNKNSYFHLHYYFLRHAANKNGTLLIIALRRYKNTNGQWPEKLEDINNIALAETFVDPINSGSFVYKHTEDGFTLYSRGKNGIDDGGEQGYDTEDKGVPDDFMIWPRKSKSSEQQKTKADVNERAIK
jgi:hypothetical protein